MKNITLRIPKKPLTIGSIIQIGKKKYVIRTHSIGDITPFYEFVLEEKK